VNDVYAWDRAGSAVLDSRYIIERVLIPAGASPPSDADTVQMSSEE